MANALANLRACVKEFPLQEHEGNTMNLHKRWTMWIENLEYCFTFEGLDEDEHADTKKKAAMLALAGHPLRELYNTLEDGGNTYAEAEKKINDYFKGRKNLTAERYKFFCMRPVSYQETHDEWVTRLKTKGKDCEFEKMDMKEAIKLVVTIHTPLSKLQSAVIRDDMNFEQMMQQARSMELAAKEVAYMKNNGIAASQAEQQPDIMDINQLERYAAQKGMRLTPRRSKDSCRYCGEMTPHKGMCKARGAICNKCGKRNHFAKVCEAKQINNITTYPQTTQQKVPTLKVYNMNNQQPSKGYPSTDVTVNINGQPLVMQIDSGADANVIPYNVYTKMQPQPPLQPTQTKLRPYGSASITIKGMFLAEVSKSDSSRTIQATFYVSDGSASHCLMGKYTAFDLDILSININELNANTEEHCLQTKQPDPVKHMEYTQIAKHVTPSQASMQLELHLTNTTKTPQEKTQAVIQHFNEVFTGIGRHKYRQITLHIDQEVPPVVQPQRRIPFAHRDKLDVLLQELEEAEVIEHVEGPTDWVSNIVITPKTDPTKIRMNVDMTTANKAISRTRHVIPTLEELRYRMNGAKYFSKLDMNHGYNQFELDEASRPITVFYTHKGLRQFRRLTFGTNSAAEVFHNEMANTLSDIQNADNIYDDIIVYGRTQQEHDVALIRVLQRFADCGLTLGLPKCEFNVTSVKFFGVIFSAAGMTPDPAKVAALDAATPPTTATEVRSFLGMTNFSAPFIPNYANITKPLRQLTCKDHKFVWTNECEAAFNQLRDILKCQVNMAYFDPAKPTKLIVDGSRKDGVASILLQMDQSERVYKPIRFDSRATTPAEKNYSQLEIESLALMYGTIKNHMYLFGLPTYTASTDHQPLLPLYNRCKPDMPARILRHKLKLQGYNYKLIYEPGANNPSDYLSRHPLKQQEKQNQVAIMPLELVTNAVIRSDQLPAITTDEIVQAMSHDVTMQKLMKAISNGYIAKDQKDLANYKQVFNELSVDDSGTILRGDRIIIPAQLQQKVVQMAHEGHQGIVKTKQLLRSTMWFPNIDATVERAIANCLPCQAATDTKHREPLKPTPLPSQPWLILNTDLFGPIENGNQYMLVVQDAYSRYPAVEIIHSTSAEAVIPAMDRILSQLGVPEFIGSDNGPPYNSIKFQEFAKYMGFKHGRKIPLAPWTNGMAENFMHNLKKLLQTSAQEHLDWRPELQRLLRAYRGTPHSMTGKTPAELLFNGRQYRTRLPTQRTSADPIFHQEVCQQQDARKLKIKNYADKKAYVTEHRLQIGDTVLIRQSQKKKKDTPYNGTPYRIIKVKGSRVTAEANGHLITRHTNFFKRIPHQHRLRVATKTTDVEPAHLLLDGGDKSHKEPTGDEFREENDANDGSDQESISSSDTRPYIGEEEEGEEEVTNERPNRQRTIPTKFTDYEVKLPHSLSEQKGE